LLGAPPGANSWAFREGLRSLASRSPATVQEILAELEIVSRLERGAYEARIALPPGPERETAGVAMVYYRDRCSWLRCAIRDRSSDGDDLA